jgi:hypothetical protein
MHSTGESQVTGKRVCAVMNLIKPTCQVQTYKNILNNTINECEVSSMSDVAKEAAECKEDKGKR